MRRSTSGREMPQLQRQNLRKLEMVWVMKNVLSLWLEMALWSFKVNLILQIIKFLIFDLVSIVKTNFSAITSHELDPLHLQLQILISSAETTNGTDTAQCLDHAELVLAWIKICLSSQMTNDECLRDTSDFNCADIHCD